MTSVISAATWRGTLHAMTVRGPLAVSKRKSRFIGASGETLRSNPSASATGDTADGSDHRSGISFISGLLPQRLNDQTGLWCPPPKSRRDKPPAKVVDRQEGGH